MPMINKAFYLFKKLINMILNFVIKLISMVVNFVIKLIQMFLSLFKKKNVSVDEINHQEKKLILIDELIQECKNQIHARQDFENEMIEEYEAKFGPMLQETENYVKKLNDERIKDVEQTLVDAVEQKKQVENYLATLKNQFAKEQSKRRPNIVIKREERDARHVEILTRELDKIDKFLSKFDK